ncbi:MAG: L,D-transpeptidase family protein [Ruminococcus sp.]|nr:L,D-transpeptidase family protein [Ruminococcus sp.]
MSDEPRRQMSNDELARQIMETMQENERESERPKVKKAPRREVVVVKKKGMSGFKALMIAILLILLVVIGFLLFLYFRGLREAQGKFLQNTTINSVDVSNMTEAEAYNAVRSHIKTPENIVIVKLDGSKTEIPLDSIGYQDNIKATVSQYMTQQNYYLWFTHLSNQTAYNFDTSFTYDEKMLSAELKRRIINTSGKNAARDAFIRYTDNGFEIVKEAKGDAIDDTKLPELVSYVEGYLEKGIYTVDLATADLYQQPKVLANDLVEELDRLEELNDIEIKINFDFEDAVIKGADFLGWIEFEDDNALKGYTVNYDKVMDYVDKLAAKYDTYNTTREFKTTKRGTIKIAQGEGCYGYWLYKDKMCERIIDAIEAGFSDEIEPVYYVNPDSGYEYSCDPKYHTAKSDIGNTYCEVDLKNQHFWFYLEGKKMYECDIVSGKDTPERKTPGGIYKLWLKEMNKTLTGTTSAGESWSTPVTYWNNISTFGIGLHDATWHPYFGKDRYKQYGSHGCINMPLDAAKYVYENVPINTPVIMYW